MSTEVEVPLRDMEDKTVDSAQNASTIAAMSSSASKPSRTGGTYIPPARLAQMQRSIGDKNSEDYQRLSWEALKKSLNGLINKVNTANLKNIVAELFAENLIRGKGLLVKSLMKAQQLSLPFTPVYAALIAVINTKFPMIGELAVTRLISQFRRSYRRNDKAQCLPVVMFLAHLVNQQVAHEIVALQLLTLLLERPTDDSVEIAVGFIRECGAKLSDISPRPANAIFERFRNILNEGEIDKRVQYMIEVLFQVRKEKFKDHPSVKPELDLVEEEDQFTHYISIDDELDIHDELNVFKYDPDFVENENKYNQIKDEILGEAENEDDDEGEESEEENETAATQSVSIQKTTIIDRTDTNLINFRKTIYLTIMSSVDFEECCHKLLKMKYPASFEHEMCNMVVDCCSQERTYLKFFGLLSERLCKLDPKWTVHYESLFVETFNTVHRLETNRIRNISKLFSHLLISDAISWSIFHVVRLTEEDTTSASRIFLKFLLQELAEYMGLKKLIAKFDDPELKPFFSGLFPTDDSHNIRFAINYYTAIQLGGLTDGLRALLTTITAKQEKSETSRFAIEDSRYTHNLSSLRRPRSRSPSPSPSRSPPPSRSSYKYRR